MAQNPYASLPPSSFWRRLKRSLDKSSKLHEKIYIHHDDRVMSFGSCFALNMIPYLDLRGIRYLKGRDHKLFSPAIYADDPLSYSGYSCAYGNVYTSRQALQLFGDPWIEALNDYEYAAQDSKKGLVDLRRPGYPYLAKDREEFISSRFCHRLACREVLEKSSVVVFTLGLTEAWINASSGACYPVCPGTIQGSYDNGSHKFVDFTIDEITEDLKNLHQVIKSCNAKARLLLTVSPVPLVATMQSMTVLEASFSSKSKLLIACRRVAELIDDVDYFPSYELVCSSILSDSGAFQPDARTPRPEYIDRVMEVMLGSHVDRCSLSGESKHDAVDMVGARDSSVSSLILRECEESRLDMH